MIDIGASTLTGETDFLIHHTVDQRATNWALRISDSKLPHNLENAIIPLAMIVECEKTDWCGITLKLATGSRIRFPFSHKTEERPRFFNLIQQTVLIPFQFPRTLWSHPLD
jgi:hypothetical protein